MTLIQMAIAFLLLFSCVIRPFLYKPVSKNFKSKISSLFTSSWLILMLIVSFPFLRHLLIFNGKNVLSSPYILISAYKGVTLFYLIYM